MKLTLIIASAALASAVPIRVVVVSSTEAHPVAAVAPHAGHAVVSDDAGPVATLVQPPQDLEASLPEVNWLNIPPPHAVMDNEPVPNKRPHRRPCGKNKNGAGVKGKLIDIGNTFRGAFGMPLIEMMGEHMDGAKIHGGLIQITKMPGDGVHQMKHHGHGHHHGRPHHMHHGGHHSFAQRIQSALMALGPWEGRAVAFVLGCGIGVLLRMVFVMVILSYRAIKGSSRKEEEDESEVQYAVIYEYEDDAEEIAVPPPNYNLPVDEKVAPPQ